MKLCYRGVSYDYNSTNVNSTETEQLFESIGESKSASNRIYRGIKYQVVPNHKSAKVCELPVNRKLNYRGIIYFARITPQGEVITVSQAINTVKAEMLAIS